MSTGPWMMYGRNSQLTLPVFTYLSISCGEPSSSNFLQWGHESEPISISFTLALGLPIRNPAGVALTTSAQVPPGGGAAVVMVTFSSAVALLVELLLLFLLHPATASRAAAQVSRFVCFTGSMNSLDDGYRRITLGLHQRRAARSGNLGGKRLQASAKLGIGDFAKPFTQFLRHRPRFWPLRSRSTCGRLALFEHDAIDRGIAEEAINTLYDHRRQMLDQRRVRSFDQQRQNAACSFARWEFDRFGARDLGVARANDLSPTTDDRALDEAKATEGHATDVTEKLAGRARAAASGRIFLGLLSLRHALQAWHSNMVTANVAALLLQHYVDNFRRLPWRSAPGETPPEPYRVWLSEVMLQQTTVATVRPRFERFVSRWPTIEALAAASNEEILSEWAGLGYYARARNLIACAREIVRRGAFPTTVAELCQLPGIGAYTSAAIAAIAFGEHAAAVDTNVERVIARLHGLTEPARTDIERLTLAMTPRQHPGDFVQAMMDLGATV